MKGIDFMRWLRTVANGEVYECPCCGAEFLYDKDSVFLYCDTCGAEFDSIEEGINYEENN